MTPNQRDDWKPMNRRRRGQRIDWDMAGEWIKLFIGALVLWVAVAGGLALARRIWPNL